MPVNPTGPPISGGESGSGTRVCDICILKKVKCDLGRPTCSRCFERGLTCSYSSTRRKPGPPRGYQRGSDSRSRTPKSAAKAYRRRPAIQDNLDHRTETSWALDGPFDSAPAASGSSLSGSFSEWRSSQDAASPFEPIDMLPAEEDCLLDKYMETIHYAIPIFSPDRFLVDIRNDTPDSSALRTTILLITAKLTNFTFASRDLDLDAKLDQILCAGVLQEIIFYSAPSLAQFRRACLLAFYEFHQFPGQQAWLRVGKLARVAYWIGLDRIERSRSAVLQSEWRDRSAEEVEGWRLCWWCVFRLDSYVNMSAGMPHVVDEKLVHTALLSGGDHKRFLFLPVQSEGLYHDVIPAIRDATSGGPEAQLFDLHIVTTTAMRHVSRMLKADASQHTAFVPSSPSTSTGASADHLISCLRLSLSPAWTNPHRNVFAAESPKSHHERLICLLHLHMARGLIAIVQSVGPPTISTTTAQEKEVATLQAWFEPRWQRVLEFCQDTASVAEHWDAALTLTADPAVCFIVFTTLIFVHLHRKYSPPNATTTPTAAAAIPAPSALQASLASSESVLLLLLEQFATIWTLPKLLLLSYKSFRESVIGPLHYHHIQHILHRFEAPAHPHWLRFLSTAQADLLALDRELDRRYHHRDGPST